MDLNGPAYMMKDNRRRCIVSLQTCKEPKVGGLRAIAKVKQKKLNEPKIDKLIDKNVNYLQKSLARNIDVLYNMQTLKSFVTKLKSAYNCDIDKCAGMQSRFHQHLLDCHPDYFNPQKGKGEEAQTNFSIGSAGLVDGSVNTQDDLKIITRPKVEAIVKDWHDIIPFNPEETPAEEKFREQKLNDLITTITHKVTSDELTKKERDEQVKADIDKFLNEVDIHYPGTKLDVIQYKEGLRELLHGKIDNMTNDSDIYQVSYDNTIQEIATDDTVSVYDFEHEVEMVARDWLNTVPFNPDESPEEAIIREKKFDHLINKIAQKKKSGYLSDKAFDKQVKADIDQFLEEVEIWAPGSEQDIEKIKEDRRKQLYNQIANMDPDDDDDDYEPEVDAIVRNWIIDVPFNPNETAAEASLKEQKVADLVSKISAKKKVGILSNKDFDEQVKEDIDQFLDDVDVWFSGTDEDKAQFKEKLAEQLQVRIALQPKAIRRISFHPNSEASAPPPPVRRPSELKRTYTPKVEAKVRDWIGKVTFNPFESQAAANLREKHVDVLIDAITNKLMTVKSEGDFENDVKAEIDQFLNKSNVWYQSCNREKAQFKEGLKEHLYNKVSEVHQKFVDDVGSGGYFNTNQVMPNSSGKPNFTDRRASKDIYANNTQGVNVDQNYVPLQNASQQLYSTSFGSEVDKKFQPGGVTLGDQRKISVSSAVASNGYQTQSPAPNAVNYGPRPSLLTQDSISPTDNSQNYNSQTSTPTNNVERAQKRLSLMYGTGDKEMPEKVSNSRRGSAKSATRDGPRLSSAQNPAVRTSVPNSNQGTENRRRSSIKNYAPRLSINDVTSNMQPNKEINPKIKEEATRDYETTKLYSKPMNSNDIDYSPFISEPKQCVKNENNDSYYDGPDLLGQHRRKIDKKRKSPSNGTLSDPIFKYVVPSGMLCGCPTKEKTERKHSCAHVKLSDIEQEVGEWLSKSQILKDNDLGIKQEILNTLLYSVGPYLQQPSDCLNKAVLKAKIVDTLNDLGFCSSAKGNLKAQISKFAGDLSNRLIGIQSRLESTGVTSWKCNVASQKPFRDIEIVRIGPNEVLKVHLRYDFKMGVKECLKGTLLEENNTIKEDITDILLQRVELLRTGMHELPAKEIKIILIQTKLLPDSEVDIITDHIIQNTKDLLMKLNTINNRTQMNVTTSGTLSIYTSEHEILPNYSSTFRKWRGIEKLNPAEISYVNALADIIRDWLKTTADIFKVLINQDLIETMTNNLASEIADYEKLAQLANETCSEKRSFMKINIYKWLLKFDIIQDVAEAEPYAQELVETLDDIHVPDLTSRYKSIQEIMRINNDKSWLESSPLETKNILEDEILKWTNDQTSDLVTDDDKSKRKTIHEFAKKIQPKLASNKEKDVEKECKNFVKKIAKSKNKKDIESLTNSLVEKIKNVEEDNNEDVESDNKERDLVDTNRTMKRYILKYIERISATDDPLTQRAYSNLLKSELLKLDVDFITEPKGDDNKTINQVFSPEKLNHEIDYAKDISDWLKNIPIEGSYNTVGNKDRIEFVISLAKNIVDIENRRKLSRQGTHYNNSFREIISKYMEQLPVLPEQKKNVTYMVDQLQTKIDIRRNKTFQPGMNEIEHDIPAIIKVFVNIYGPDIADDELILDIWTSRMLKEVQNKLAIERSSAPVGEWKRYVAGQDLVDRFQLEFNFIPEITDWLKNFTVTDTVDVTMVTDLAEKAADYSSKLIYEQEFKRNIKEFISKLKLDEQKEFDEAFIIQQLITRINNYKENTDSLIPLDVFQVSDTKIKPEKSKSKRSKSKKSNGATGTFVQIIEKWCEDLPIKGKQKGEIEKAKNDIATKLYQKIGDLNDDPDINDNLFKEVLTNELNDLFDKIPEGLKLDGKQDKLKQKLIDKLIEAKLVMKQSAASDNYKQKLKDTLETSLPSPVALQDVSPGFELYKNHLTNMFLLDNFDDGNYASKLKYEKRIKNNMDTYCRDAQIRNTVPITKDQLYNHLYSSLYKVEIPNDIDLKNEVEKVKTKYVIEEWFEQLPIKVTNEISELLDRDQRIDVLTDKIYQAENENASPEKLITVIEKWLQKSEFIDNAEDVSKHAVSLHQILESSENTRKCSIPSGNKKMSKEFDLFAGDVITNTKVDDTGIWVNPNNGGKLLNEQSVQKSGDMILDIVEQWCTNLFLLPCTTQDQIQAVKDDIVTKLTMKISELNSRSDIFQENQLYDHLLGQEIVKLLKVLVPQCSGIPQCQDALKNQLIVAINSVKPVIEEERARHEYKKDLENTINNFLQTSQLPTSAEAVVSASVKEDLVNNFIEYQYNQDDEEGRLYYKIKIFQSILKYNMSTGQHKNFDDLRRDTVRKGNQLICELLKIPSPGNQAIKHEVEEIRMKHVVNEFFNKTYPMNPEKCYLQNLLANSLAKQLNDIEKSGYNTENEQKIKTVIARATIRLNGESKDSETDALIQKLKETEKIRRACPPNSPSRSISPVKAQAPFVSPYQRTSSVCFNTSIPQRSSQVGPLPDQSAGLISPQQGDVVENWSMTDTGPQVIQQNVDFIVHQPNEQTPNAVATPGLGDGQSIEVQMFDYGPQPNQISPIPQTPVLKDHTSSYNGPNLESLAEGPVYIDKETDPFTKDVTINTGYYSNGSVTDNMSSESSDSIRCLCDMYPAICDGDGSRPCSFYAPIMPMPFMTMRLPLPMQFPYMY